MTSTWLGLAEDELVEVPERVLRAIARRISEPNPEARLREELMDRLRDSMDQLRDLARTDGLTRLANRRAVEERLTDEAARARRHRRSLAVLLIDVDHLKTVNDTLGHGAGDELLREVGARIQAMLRMTDLAGRWGGDEFVVICPETDSRAARALASKLATAVANREMTVAGRQLRARVSIGFAVDGQTGDPASLLAAADAALYEDKRLRTLRGARRPFMRVVND